jgi:prevent-host-death family protein
MSDPSRPPARVGVRELRQNLSVYLRRVKDGESLEVTEHGVPVARLEPRRTARMPVLDRLIAEGRATPATRQHRDLPPPPEIPGRPLSEILREMRDEDDR